MDRTYEMGDYRFGALGAGWNHFELLKFKFLCVMQIVSIMIGLALLLVPSGAIAAPVDTACSYVGGCGPINVLFNAIPLIGNMLVAVGAGLAVLFVVVGGALMLISAGDEGQVQKGKMSITYALVGLGLVLVSQSVVAFIAGRFGGLATSTDPVFAAMNFAVSAMVTVFNAIFALMMVIAGFRMAFARGNSDEFTKARGMIIWAIAGTVVVNVANSLISAVMNLPL